MDAIGYSLKMNFADFFGAEVEKREVNGIMEDCLVIPMRLNGIYLSKKKGNRGVLFYATAMPSKTSLWGQSHYLVQSPKEEIQKELIELGYKPRNIFGFMKCIFRKKEKHREGNLKKLDQIIFGDF